MRIAMRLISLLLFVLILHLNRTIAADVGECADVCGANGECVDTGSGPIECTCNEGFEMQCQNVDECARGTDDCDENAVCIDTPCSYRCEKGASAYCYLPYQLSWSAAKFLCDCFGHQAVVDTLEKQQKLLKQIDIPHGECAWIGASTLNVPGFEFRWLQLPISYGTPVTNGESLRTTFNNFTSECGPGMYKGKIPATNIYCRVFNGGNDACVPCEDGTEKLGFGNSKDLCVPLL